MLAFVSDLTKSPITLSSSKPNQIPSTSPTTMWLQQKQPSPTSTTLSAGPSPTLVSKVRLLSVHNLTVYYPGYNCCLFAYGQTGAGKTHTIQGQSLDGLDPAKWRLQDGRGLLPRVLEYLFGKMTPDTNVMQLEGSQQPASYSVRCSYLEIYNEQIIDLVSDTLQFCLTPLAQ